MMDPTFVKLVEAIARSVVVLARAAGHQDSPQVKALREVIAEWNFGSDANLTQDFGDSTNGRGDSQSGR